MSLSTLAANLGKIVRAALADHSRTQRQLAERLGVSHRTVERRLSGENGFNVEELFAAARWLGEDAGDWLLEAGMNELVAA